jgi:hypothetical protein
MPMNFNKNTENLKENLGSIPKNESESLRNLDDSSEVKDAIKSAGGSVDAIGLNESVETTGHVSEKLSDQTSEQGGSSGAVFKKTVDPDLIKESLLRELPTEESMRRQIESEIKKEITYLHKKALKMVASPGSLSFFEMSNLVRKIRELKGILLSLAKVSLDSLKTLWLRFVHGIM